MFRYSFLRHFLNISNELLIRNGLFIRLRAITNEFFVHGSIVYFFQRTVKVPVTILLTVVSKLCFKMIENDIFKCRICLLDGNIKASLYNDENSSSYYVLIKDFTGFELTQNDNLSSLICDSCISELTTVIKFITKVKISCERLKYFHNFDDSCEKNDSNSIKDEDDDLPLSFISAGVFNSIKDELQSKVLDDIKQEGVDFHEGDLSLNNLIPCESYRIFCSNGEEEDSSKRDNSLKLVSTFEDRIANRRLLKPQMNERRIAKHSRSKEISRLKCLISKTDRLHIKKARLKKVSKVKFTVLTSKEHGLKKDMLKCLVCGVVVQNKSASVVHIRKHTGEQPYQCACCKKKFTQSGTLNSHMKKSHPKEWTNMLASLKKEKKVKERRKDKTLKYKREVEGGVMCDYCGKSFKRKGTLVIHLRTHTNEKPYACSYCPRRFPQTSSLKDHIRARHTLEKPYFCHMCGKPFSSRTNFRVHLLSHVDEKRFKCKMCDAAVKTKENLRRHIVAMHSTKNKICHICGAAFALTYYLNQHIKTRHSKQQKLELTYIGRTYTRRSTGNIVVQCEVCKKPFSNLEKHMKRHTDEQPFGCDFCHKRFFQKKHLLRHVKKHQDQCMNFACTYNGCNSAFSKKSMLNYHVSRFHTKIASFVCQFCSRGYYRNSDLRRHILANHELKPDSNID